MVYLDKAIWRNTIFLGHYKERRFVPEVNDYRDLIVISPAETKLIKCLSKFRKEMRSINGTQWLGIDGPEKEDDFSGHHVWVQLNRLPFGHFWFQMKKAQVQNGEVIFKIRCIRELNEEDYRDALMETNTKCNKIISSGSENNLSVTNLYTGRGSLNFNKLITLINFLLTFESLILIMKFICVTALVLLEEILNAICNLGMLTLKFVDILILFTEMVTLLCMHLMNCLSKLITSGFHALFAFINKERTSQHLVIPAIESRNDPIRQLSDG